MSTLSTHFTHRVGVLDASTTLHNTGSVGKVVASCGDAGVRWAKSQVGVAP